MFTGLIEETATVASIEMSAGTRRLRLAAPKLSQQIKTGDSIAVNGCCLTLVGCTHQELCFDLLEETLSRTNLSRLEPGQLVNVERALAAGSAIGGHFVQGHVDCTAEIISCKEINGDHRLEIALPREGARYVAAKGSIAIDGISLTVADIDEDSFVVWIIPHTWRVTNLKQAPPGTLVNLEFDLLAKYVERILSKPLANTGLSLHQGRACDDKTPIR